MKPLRHAFTLVELVAVIVIFGIVAAIGSEIYVKIYENYMVSRVMNNLQTKTELALEQIAKRLQYRIKDATIARKPSGEYISTADPSLDANYTILEWIGYDNEGLKGESNGSMYIPAWSGFIDVEDSNATYLSTPGSNLDKEDTIIQAISHSVASITDAGIIFSGTSGDYNVSKYGWLQSGNSEYVYDIAEHNKTVIMITDTQKPHEIYERYKLTWTAYAIVPGPIDSPNSNDKYKCNYNCPLYLFTNFQPWKGEDFNTTDKNVLNFLLLEHVTTFKFKQDGDILRIKLCVGDKIVDKDVSICKEKVVF